MDMCRFTGPNDIEYRKVASALRRMTSTVSRQLGREKKVSFNEENKKLLLESLRFEQIHVRQMTIRKAHAKTCKWLLKKSEFRNWLDFTQFCEHHGFLWIKGKPGTGKSTLMKFVLANARSMMKDRIVISFFFNARGEHLEKSTLGAYQSLLLQLLERLPVPESVFDILEALTWSNSVDSPWSIESLKALLEQVILSLGDSSVVCFIDALDECDERQIRDMVSFFEHIGELAVSAQIRFQVCFSSRHYPHITIGRGLGLVLEGQEGHTQDIINYLDSELRIGHSKIAEQIRTDIQERASGVFMWIVLVVEILNKEHDSGRIHALRRRLHELPGDLHELFRDILTRDSHNRDELILCIQWVLFAKQPLRPEQLYFAILSGVEPQTLSKWDPDEISIRDIQRFILSSSKGLAEITMSETPKVQFIHESVRDFLLNENGLGKIWSELESNFEGHSHERLKQCCNSYIKLGVALSLGLGENLPKASSEEATALRKSATDAFPFLEYAVHHLLYHADVAQRCNFSQVNFIQSFQRIEWIRLSNLLEKNQVRRHTQNASLLYVLAELNMSNLIEIHPSVLLFLEVEDERYGLPLFASLATGSESAVRTFLKACTASQSSGSRLHQFCDQYKQRARRQASIGRGFVFSKRRTVFSYLAEFGDEVLLSIALILIPTPGAKDKDGQTPLSWAARNGHEAIIKLLLETNRIDVNSRDKHNRTALSWATLKGHETIVKLLLETNKIDLNSGNICPDGQTPLSWAVRNGRNAIVKLLLETNKTDVSSRDYENRTPLSWAAINGHEAIVKVLLETNQINVDVRDKYDRTPLWWAASEGYETIVKLLLETNQVNVNSRDKYGQTPLSKAAANEHESIVKLLLDTNKIDNIEWTDRYGHTPLSWAARYGHESIVKLIEEYLQH